jgi:hypothetical protein
MEPIDGNYGLLVDNLMDLSHEAYLHGGYIGPPLCFSWSCKRAAGLRARHDCVPLSKA